MFGIHVTWCLMCLHKVNKTFDPPMPIQDVGYKIFKLISNKLYPAFVHAMLRPQLINYGQIELNVHKWIEDINDDYLKYGEITYRTGFHVFKSLEITKQITQSCRSYRSVHYSNKDEFIVVKVEYSDVVAEGTQKFEIINPEPRMPSDVITIEPEVIVCRKIHLIVP
jgi:hypothetical protein